MSIEAEIDNFQQRSNRLIFNVDMQVNIPIEKIVTVMDISEPVYKKEKKVSYIRERNSERTGLF